jgi:hypothetical protein
MRIRIHNIGFYNRIIDQLEEVRKTGAGMFKQSKGARNEVGTGLSYRPDRLHRLAELIPWNRFLGPFKV